MSPDKFGCLGSGIVLVSDEDMTVATHVGAKTAKRKLPAIAATPAIPTAI